MTGGNMLVGHHHHHHHHHHHPTFSFVGSLMQSTMTLQRESHLCHPPSARQDFPVVFFCNFLLSRRESVVSSLCGIVTDWVICHPKYIPCRLRLEIVPHYVEPSSLCCTWRSAQRQTRRRKRWFLDFDPLWGNSRYFQVLLYFEALIFTLMYFEALLLLCTFKSWHFHYLAILLFIFTSTELCELLIVMYLSWYLC